MARAVSMASRTLVTNDPGNYYHMLFSASTSPCKNSVHYILVESYDMFLCSITEARVDGTN